MIKRGYGENRKMWSGKLLPDTINLILKLSTKLGLSQALVVDNAIPELENALVLRKALEIAASEYLDPSLKDGELVEVWLEKASKEIQNETSI